MDKKEIKDLLLDFTVEYDPVMWSNEKVYDKYTEIFYKKFADLEAKLEESEKKFIIANNLRKNSDEILLNYKTEKYGLEKTIKELRKMKLNLPEKEWYYKGFENCERQMSSHIADLTLEVEQLKQALVERTKMVEELTTFNNFIKNQTAIEELEKVKELFKKCWWETDDFDKFYNNYDDQIDQQIRVLKGDADEH